MNKYFKTAFVIIYYFIYSVIIYIPFVVLNIPLENIPDALFNTYYISVEVIFIISLLYLYREDFKLYIADFKKNGKKHLKLGFNCWVVGLCIMIASNVIIGALTPISMPENEQAIRETLKLSPLFVIFASIIEAPLIEEMLFRKTLFDIIKNKTLFIIVSGIIFGAFHIIGVGTTLYSWLYIIPYAALGMTFAYTFVKTNNLLTPMILHAFHNFITVVQVLLLLRG